jgi:hypothetical protein
MDRDYVEERTFADWDTVEAAIDHFDTKISRRVLSAFGNSRTKLRAFVEQMEGETFTPGNIDRVIKKSYRGDGNIYALAHFFGIVSGAGTLVRINDENYYYNFGYKSGEDPDDVKSGRSYGATLLHNANDASCVMYLGELEAFLEEGRGARQFYSTMLDFLLRSDASGISKLSKAGQAAMTDYIAIYTAELNRHIMVDLNPAKHPWENDLSEATFVSLYSQASGHLVKDGELVRAPLKDFWGMSSTGSGRSGIGIGRKDRREMQRRITAYLRENHAEKLEAVEAVIGDLGSRGDVFRGLMEYLNNYSTQRSVKKNADALQEAFLEVLMVIEKDAKEITRFIQG